jgi:predicted ester cyclase
MIMSQSRLRQWCDQVWNNAKEDSIDELMDESAVIHGLETDKDKFGPNAFKPFYQELRKTFPSVTINLEPIIITEDFEAGHCAVKGITADGKEVNFTGLAIAKYKGGKIIEAWNGFDFSPVEKQLKSTETTNSNQPR